MHIGYLWAIIPKPHTTSYQQPVPEMFCTIFSGKSHIHPYKQDS